jgi:DNA-binding NarL/FixJ family response regulator
MRTLLAQGTVLRRARQRRHARVALAQALAIFDRLGMPLWAARTRAESARIGGPAAAADGLTATEMQVAELAATGLTNREIASHAGMSFKTVESHLGRAYGKLSIRSRTELARAISPSRDAAVSAADLRGVGPVF